jgi:Zn-dependent M28 family amino/carboxypeptidase
MKNVLILCAFLAGTQVQCQIPAANQILRDIQILSADSLEGRATGTEGAEKARKYLLSRYDEIGLQAFNGSYIHSFDVRDKKGHNLVGYLPGEVDSAIVVTAHYDHLGIKDGAIFNGADDNASGVAGLLSIAHAFSQMRSKHTLIFVAFDAEEMGLRGAAAFLANSPTDKGLIKLNVNMDMIAHNNVDEIYAVGTYHYPELMPILEQVRNQTSITIKFGHDKPQDTLEDWTFSSDHGPFHKAGIPFVYFGVEDHEDYHTSTDTFEKINQAFVVKAVEAITNFTKMADSQL